MATNVWKQLAEKFFESLNQEETKEEKTEEKEPVNQIKTAEPLFMSPLTAHLSVFDSDIPFAAKQFNSDQSIIRSQDIVKRPILFVPNHAEANANPLQYSSSKYTASVQPNAADPYSALMEATTKVYIAPYTADPLDAKDRLNVLANDLASWVSSTMIQNVITLLHSDIYSIRDEAYEIMKSMSRHKIIRDDEMVRYIMANVEYLFDYINQHIGMFLNGWGHSVRNMTYDDLVRYVDWKSEYYLLLSDEDKIDPHFQKSGYCHFDNIMTYTNDCLYRLLADIFHNSITRNESIVKSGLNGCDYDGRYADYIAKYDRDVVPFHPQMHPIEIIGEIALIQKLGVEVTLSDEAIKKWYKSRYAIGVQYLLERFATVIDKAMELHGACDIFIFNKMIDFLAMKCLVNGKVQADLLPNYEYIGDEPSDMQKNYGRMESEFFH